MTTLRLYKSYSFRDKDPILGATSQAIKESGLSYADIEAASGVSRTTLWNWEYGTTLRPQFCTVVAVHRALGFDLRWVRSAKIVSMEKHRKRA